MIRTSVILTSALCLCLTQQVAASLISTAVGNGADASVSGGSKSGDNFGAGTFIQGKNAGDLFFADKGYIRFDISSITDPILDVTLRLETGHLSGVFSPNSAPTYNVFGLADGVGENWGENLITWDNAPANVTTSGFALTSDATFLGTIFVPTTAQIGDSYALNSAALLNFIQSDTNGLVTFITTDAGQLISGQNFASKESTVANAPTLDIRTSVPEPATLALLSLSLLGVGYAKRRSSR